MFVESILVGVEASELSFIPLPSPVHRCILLMAEDYAVAGVAFTTTLPALTAGWLDLIAFELSLPASLAGRSRQKLVISPDNEQATGARTSYHPVRDLIANISSSWV